MKVLLILSIIISIYSLSFLLYNDNFTIYAQQDLETIKFRDLVIDLGDGIKTNAQLTIPAVGNGPFPAVLLITGSGAEDMNETAGYIRIDNVTGSKIYPPTPFFQIAEYLSDRGFVTLRYDKRAVSENHTIIDSNVWGNLTINNIIQDANEALTVLMQQPEVDVNRITVLGHSEGTVVTPRVAIDNPDKVKNIVLMGVLSQHASKMLEYQRVGLPLLYAKQVLDKDKNGFLSVKEASQDVTFQSIIGGNLSFILTEYLANNNTEVPKLEYNPNNDAFINIETELRPALIEISKTFFSPSSSSSNSSDKCTNLEGCPLYLESFLKLEPNLNTISKVPLTTSLLILNGENDTQTPVEGAFLLQQKLTEINHSDHVLITYPNLGHEFYPSSQWQTRQGPIQQYVLADIYSWLEPHNGFTPLTTISSNSYSSNTTKINN